MNKQNFKNLIIEHLLTLTWAILVLLIQVSDHIYYRLSDIKIGDKSPINLLRLGFKEEYLLKKGEILTIKLNIFINGVLSNNTLKYIIFISLFYIAFLIFVKTVRLSRTKLTIIILITLLLLMYSKMTISYLNISIFTLPFIGIIGFLLLFYEKRVIVAFTILSVFIIAIPYHISMTVVYPFLIAGLFSLLLFKKDNKDLNYIVPFTLGTLLLLLITTIMNLLTDLSLFDNLISISWTLLSLPIFYLIVQLLKIYTSVFTKYNLMEYVNLDHPLLKKLKKEAPGTYQHSLAMANLAETAANEIGANGILCRVGAYYHDIGKTVSPNFFTENQQGKSPHSVLEPIESANIIMSHVTNGTRLAKEYKLPKYITQFITTHHGTTVLEYFFDKANSTNKIQPNPNDFRYPGDKPTNKETAILMIVDSVEAASRSLDEITKDKLDELISKIVFKKILLNQLSKSTLTLTELRTIVLTLIDSLVNNSHSRIKYPWQKKLEDSQKIITKQIIKEKLPDTLSEDDKEEILKEIIEENSLKNSQEMENIEVEDSSKPELLKESSKEIKELNKPEILED